MSVDANALERETLERKDRDELAKIAGALGGKVTSRTRKADIIDLILELTGVTAPTAAESAASQSPEAASTDSARSSGADLSDAKPDNAKPGDAKPENAKPANDGGRQSVSATRAQNRNQDNGGRNDADSKNDGEHKDGGARNGGGDGQKNGGQKNGGQKSGGQQGGGQNDPGPKNSQQSNGQQNNGQNGANDDDDDDGNGRRRRRRGRNRDASPSQDEYTGEPIPVVGCLDLRDDGYGFLRVDGMLPSKDDCYVSVKQVRQFGLRKGDVIAGGSRPAFRNEKNPAILRIDSINGVEVAEGDDAPERPLFEALPAAFATEAISLVADGNDDATARALELLAPIGKGSRVLLAAPPRSGKTTILQTVAHAIEANDPDTGLIVVLLDERPEEITEMERFVAAGTVHGSAFDASPDEHVAVLELALARARRAAESGDDVVVLVDGLTRLARAEAAASQGSGRSIGGLDTNAIAAAKRAFGTARNLEGAGSITMVGVVNVGTGSDVDDAVYDSVVGAATTEIRLDADAAARRSFPALDIARTGTRREELLVGDDGAQARNTLRSILASLPDGESADHADGLDSLLGRIRSTKSNDDLLEAAAKERA